MELKDLRHFIAYDLKATSRQLWDDLYSAKAARGLGWWSFFFVWCGGLLATIAVIALVGAIPESDSPCMPDGSFNLRPDLYSPWSVSAILQIGYGSGSFSFPVAKLIDVIWDFTVGRGVQLILGLISCFVFARYITAVTSVSPVTYATYRTAFFRTGPDAASIFTLLREFIWYHALDSKAAMVWIILSASFVAIFPTWISASSGYTGNVGAYVSDVNGNLVSFSQFGYIEYVVRDGDRIGLIEDYYVAGSFDLSFVNDLGNSCDDLYAVDACDDISEASCYLRCLISDYASVYGFYGTNNANSRFQNYTLSAPSLNISAYYIASTQIYGRTWVDPSTGKLPFANYSQATFLYNNLTYPLDYMSRKGTCQPLGTYAWGFSLVPLVTLLLGLFLWSIGTYIFWLRSHLTLRAREIHEVPGQYKAIIELAYALQREFAETRKDPISLSESEITRKIRGDLKGGRIMYDQPMIQQSKYRLRTIFTRWLKREKWWLLPLVILLSLTSSVPITTASTSGFFILSITSAASFSILVAMFMGMSTGSGRVLFVLGFMALVLIVFLGIVHG